MNGRRLFLTGAVVLSTVRALAACATTEAASRDEPPGSVVPPVDSGAGDAMEAGDSGPCDDCEFFPEACSGDVLCPNGPFGTDDGFDPRTQIEVIAGRSATDVWVAGALGAVAHFDGSAWKRSELGKRETVRGLWLRGSSEIALVSLAELHVRGLDIADAGDASAGGWASHDPPTSPEEYGWWSRNLHSAWAAPGAQWLWGATSNICNAYQCWVDPSPTSGIWRVRETSPTTFEIGTGIASEACREISCGDMTSVHGSSPDDLWAVGYTGATLRITNADTEEPHVRAFNSQTWDALHGVWSSSPSDAWAVGANGCVRHYRGDPVLWDVVSGVPTTNDLHAVWGSSPSDVWAVGEAATVLHYDGKTWSRVKIAGLGARRPKLTAVWVPSPGHVWIGGQGVVLSLGGKP